MAEPVRAVTRAFSVLQAVVAAPRSASLAQITKATRLPKSSVSRMLDTLEHLDMVEPVGQRGVYRVGPGLQVLAGGGSSPQVLKQLARPHLENLVSRLGEDATLSIPENRDMLYISQVTADRTVQVQDWTGYTFPMHTVGAGQVCLATWDSENLEAYLRKGLVRMGKNTLVTRSALMSRLEAASRDGYAWHYRECADDITGVGAPVTGPNGDVVAALAVHGPSYRFPGEGSVSEMGALVRDFAHQLSADLAGFPYGLRSEFATTGRP